MDERGIVLTHQMTQNLFSGAIDNIELRKHLLYWDFIDFPSVNGIGSNLLANPDTNLLMKQGFIRQTNVLVPSPFPFGQLDFSNMHEIYKQMLLGQYKVAEEYHNKEIICSISQYNVSLEVPQTFQSEIEILEMELINCFPHPSENTQIVDILEFKDRRKDELMMLRYKLDDIYLLASANIHDLRTKSKAIDDFKNAIIDIDKLFNESAIDKCYSAFKVLLKIPFDLYGGYLIGQAAAPQLNLTLLNGGLLGAAVGAVLLKVNLKQILGPKEIPVNQKDFAYLYQAKKELATMNPIPDRFPHP